MGRIFAGNDQGLGVDAGFQGIHGGAGLARSGARARGGAAGGAGLRRFFHMWAQKEKAEFPEISVSGRTAYGGFDFVLTSWWHTRMGAEGVWGRKVLKGWGRDFFLRR